MATGRTKHAPARSPPYQPGLADGGRKASFLGRDGTADRTLAHVSSVQYPWCTERPGGEVLERVYLGGVDPHRIKPE